MRLSAARAAQAALGAQAPRLVVVAFAPDSVLTDWAERADAAAVVFLGGEQTGALRAAYRQR